MTWGWYKEKSVTRKYYVLLMDDKRLIELAAKAAGYEITSWGRFSDGEKAWVTELGGWWNPLNDDGDSLRLAVKLRIRFEVHSRHPFVAAWVPEIYRRLEEETGDDPCKATRRAILRAAAALGLMVV